MSHVIPQTGLVSGSDAEHSDQVHSDALTSLHSDLQRDNNRLITLLQTHLTRYPAMGVMDSYRLLHQAVFGAGSVKQFRSEREWLESEIGLIGSWIGTDESSQNIPLIESIHPRGEMVRLHLRPYLALGGRHNLLLDSYIASHAAIHTSAGKLTEPDQAQLAAWYAHFQRATSSIASAATVMPATSATRSEMPFAHFNARSVALFGAQRQREGWSAVPHSVDYLRLYHPLYRVLRRDHALDLIATQRIEGVIV